MVTKPKNGQPGKREESKARTRRALLETARRLFVEQGTQAVSVSGICKAADISRPTFYRCFPDKAALVEYLKTF